MHGSEILIPDSIWYPFLFAFGCCVGSFLNVVIYRLPKDKSLVMPPSSCPKCGKYIRWYDNVPLVSWLLLGGKCRACKAPISPRYFVIELLTGLLFIGLFYLYFRSGLRTGVPSILSGGWLIYLVSVFMLSAFIAASAIDLELWIIPLSICWLATTAGLAACGVAPYFIDPAVIRQYLLLPSTSDLMFRETTVASITAGATIGLGISNLLLVTGILKRSYDLDQVKYSAEQTGDSQNVQDLDDRREVCREIIFLLPMITCAALAGWLASSFPDTFKWWQNLLQQRAVAGLLGGLWGYLVGGGIVWVTRILGTLAFGKEAMGLGDVHLMAAAGAVIGPLFVVAAFFIAPFFGLVWAGIQMLSKKTHQIPYGPFLSLGVLAVMILHDRIMVYLSFLLYG